MKKTFLLIFFISLIFSFSARADTFVNGLSDINVTRSASLAELSWTNPTHISFDKAIVFRSGVLIEDYFSYEAIEAFCDKIYEGEKENFTDSGLAENLSYYYIFFSKNQDGNYSKATVIKDPVYQKDDFQEEEEEEEEEEEKEETNNIEENNNQSSQLANANSQVVNEVSLHEAGIVFNYNKVISEPQNSNSGRLALFIMVKSPHELNDKDKRAISYFIDAGTPTTIILGAGERAGVLNSYLSVFDKLPREVLEWQDIIKIANGRWPNERNIESEKKATDIAFNTIYKRAPDMDNPNDNAAVTVIAYGLRPANRNMENEKKAIEIYRSIFNASPAEASDWDLVRAIAYSGAVR